MKNTEMEKIREMNDTELQNRLKDLKTELFNLRFQHAINQLDNPMRLKAVRKEIAIIKTVVREKELKTVGLRRCQVQSLQMTVSVFDDCVRQF